MSTGRVCSCRAVGGAEEVEKARVGTVVPSCVLENAVGDSEEEEGTAEGS